MKCRDVRIVSSLSFKAMADSIAIFLFVSSILNNVILERRDILLSTCGCPHIVADHSIEKLTAVNEKDNSNAPSDSNIPLPVTNGWQESDTVSQSAKEPTSPPRKRPAEWEVLTKDYFSFNTRVKLGDFMEQKPGERVSCEGCYSYL